MEYMYRQRGGFVGGQNSLQAAAGEVGGDLVGDQPGDAEAA